MFQVDRYAVFFRPTLPPRVDTSLGFGELALSAFCDLFGVPSRVNGATRPVTARRAAINSRASAGRRNDPTARAAGDVTMHCSWYSWGLSLEAVGSVRRQTGTSLKAAISNGLGFAFGSTNRHPGYLVWRRSKRL